MKKIVSLLLACLMIVGVMSLAGCGKTENTTTDDTTAAADNSGSTDNTAAGGAIKIGGTGPLTGGAAIYGNAAKNGAQIAVDEINALGGLQFELKYEDDTHDPEKAVNAFNTLKDWGMQVSLGSVTSKPAVATSQESADIFFLTPSASSTDVLGGVENPLTGTVEIERKPTIFQMCFMDPNQGLASAQYISEQKLGTKIAVIYKNDDVYSTGIYNSFKEEAEKLGLEIVSTTTFTDDTSTDFSVQVADAKNNGADLVFLPMYYEAASMILIEANKQNFTPKFFGVDGMDGILTLEGFDTSLAEGVILLTPFNADSEDEKTVNFVKAYQDKFGEIPNQFAADGYDCVYAIYEALKDEDVSASTSAADLCTLLTEKFASGSFTYSGLTGENMTWNDSGMVSKSPKGMVIENGAYVGLD
ncbi:MAG: ABC transporter substrate-binding protein [Clostridia bacterium]|nr:ABC transporter substrate-binding protein [Clostridia bacterium]